MVNKRVMNLLAALALCTGLSFMYVPLAYALKEEVISEQERLTRALFKAVFWDGNVQEVRSLLKQGANPALVPSYPGSRMKLGTMLEIALSSAFNVLYEPDTKPDTRIHQSVAIAHELINHGAPITDEALGLAVVVGNQELIKTMTDKGANINSPAIKEALSMALEKAIRKGTVKDIRDLVKKGADPRTKSREEPFLAMALSNGPGGFAQDEQGRTRAKAIARELLLLGAPITDEALQAAVFIGDLDLVQTMLKGGANINAKANDLTVLSCAIVSYYIPEMATPQSLSIIELLLKNKAKIDPIARKIAQGGSKDVREEFRNPTPKKRKAVLDLLAKYKK